MYESKLNAEGENMIQKFVSWILKYLIESLIFSLENSQSL